MKYFQGINNLKRVILMLFALSILIAGCSEGLRNDAEKNTASGETANEILTINPDDFTTQITNPYFPMSVGKKMVYEAVTEEGIERIEIFIPGWTKTIMGVETLVFWDRVFVDGELVEDTRDYVAQDKEGNVWYFGENVDNYVAGKLLHHHGAWIGGLYGAEPGIWMPANPEVGMEYKQEYYEGEAEDMARIDGIGFEVKVPAGSYSDCVQIFEWTPLEDATAYKYHCNGIGTVLEEEEDEQVKLLEVDEKGAYCVKLPERYAAEGVEPGSTSICNSYQVTEVSEEIEELVIEMNEQRAREIALEAVPGIVTDVEIEQKFGKIAYVVEVDAYNGDETDVIIDMETGDILGIEN